MRGTANSVVAAFDDGAAPAFSEVLAFYIGDCKYLFPMNYVLGFGVGCAEKLVNTNYEADPWVSS